jgi:membrane-bound lytic murein transglycosylase B
VNARGAGPGFWRRQGVTLADGGQVPDHGDASILLPAGADGVALMIFDNFRVIERYNPADAYVIGVGHLSDRIAGGPAFRSGWPRGDRALTGDERRELQQRLTAAGFSTGNIDGIIGPHTQEAVRRFQRSVGAVPDGYASLRLLERLR